MKKAIPIEKGNEYTAKIDSVSSEGNGVCRIDGDTVFVYIYRKGEPGIKGIKGLGYFKIASDDTFVPIEVYETEN